MVPRVRRLAARTRSAGWEDPVEHGHPDRGHHAAARALHDTEEHQLGHVLGQAAQCRAEGEDDDGGEQDPLAAEAVAQPARRRDEHGQADQVGDHDAVHGGRRNVEVASDGGERDVHDRDVHDVHEHRRHEHDADGDLLVHASDGHVLFRFDGLRAKRVGDGRRRATAPPCCAPRPYALVPAVPRRPRPSPRPLPGPKASFRRQPVRRPWLSRVVAADDVHLAPGRPVADVGVARPPPRWSTGEAGSPLRTWTESVLDSGDAQGHRRRQPEGRRGQDDHRAVAGRRPGRNRDVACSWWTSTRRPA